MKKIVYILSVFITNIAFAQTKYNTTTEDFNNFHVTVSYAERMYKNDSLLEAFGQYGTAFENYKGAINPTHYFKATLCALKIREEFKALDYLEKAIKNGYVIDSNKISLIVFNNQNTNNEYRNNINKWTRYRDSCKNAGWQNEIYALKENGKKYSTSTYKTATESCINCLKNKNCNKTTPDYLSKYKLVKEKMKADSVTVSKLLSSIKQFGFPNLKFVDINACAITRTILLNYDSDKKNERLNDILFKALNDGYISPSFYALLIDRRNIMNGLSPEFYEPITGYEKTIGKDLLIANNKRKTIGLYPIILPKATAKEKPVAGTKALTTVETNLYDY